VQIDPTEEAAVQEICRQTPDEVASMRIRVLAVGGFFPALETGNDKLGGADGE
jgi:hypothetical protein